jgi:iron complex transport system substrate-binding protein
MQPVMRCRRLDGAPGEPVWRLGGITATFFHACFRSSPHAVAMLLDPPAQGRAMSPLIVGGGRSGWRVSVLCWGLALTVGPVAQAAPVSVVDDHGDVVTLSAPARHIVSLAPHTTELLFAAGAADRVVATVRYADYPPAAQKVPQVGDTQSLDLERIAALKPDLIVVWMHGNAMQQIERLRALGLPIFHSEPHKIVDIADSLRRLGKLAATDAQAERAARAFETEHRRLQSRYSKRPAVRVFYQVWDNPVMTVNDDHLISDVLRLCGGQNVFGHLDTLVPTMDVEAVLKAHPQVLIAGLPGGEEGRLDRWREFKHFEPVEQGLLFTVPADLISRHGPRILLGAQRICTVLDEARQKLGLTER